MSLEKRPVTRFELLMDAGTGAQKAGDILLGAFVEMGQLWKESECRIQT